MRRCSVGGAGLVVGLWLCGCFTPTVGEQDTDAGTSGGSTTAGSGTSASTSASGTGTTTASSTSAGTTGSELCGNGILDPGEDCEDGNQDDSDACVRCKTAVCGDGFLYAALEECDDGNDVDEDECKSDCVTNVCQDGVLNPAAEECDDGNDDDEDSCRADCTLAYCGDGVRNVDEEECDDGDAVNTDGCKNDCTLAVCGDGVVYEGEEECDDGDDDDTDQCTTACQDAECGDGFMQLGEDCDDNNTDPFDGCSPVCDIEPYCYGLGSADCPSGLTQYCRLTPADCENENDALLACQVCMGPGNGCQVNQQVCNESRAVQDTGACPDAFAFVYVSDVCSAGNILTCNGSNQGGWCTPL